MACLKEQAGHVRAGHKHVYIAGGVLSCVGRILEIASLSAEVRKGLFLRDRNVPAPQRRRRPVLGCTFMRSLDPNLGQGNLFVLLRASAVELQMEIAKLC